MTSVEHKRAIPGGGFVVGPRVPQGLAAAVEGLTREVLRHHPEDIYSFAARHFEKLLEMREQRGFREQLRTGSEYAGLAPRRRRERKGKIDSAFNEANLDKIRKAGDRIESEKHTRKRSKERSKNKTKTTDTRRDTEFRENNESSWFEKKSRKVEKDTIRRFDLGNGFTSDRRDSRPLDMDRIRKYVARKFRTSKSYEELRYVEKVQEVIDRSEPIVKAKLEELKSIRRSRKSIEERWIENETESEKKSPPLKKEIDKNGLKSDANEEERRSKKVKSEERSKADKWKDTSRKSESMNSSTEDHPISRESGFHRERSANGSKSKGDRVKSGSESPVSENHSKISLPAVRPPSCKNSRSTSRSDSDDLVLPPISPEAPKSSKKRDSLTLPALSGIPGSSSERDAENQSPKDESQEQKDHVNSKNSVKDNGDVVDTVKDVVDIVKDNPAVTDTMQDTNVADLNTEVSNSKEKDLEQSPDNDKLEKDVEKEIDIEQFEDTAEEVFKDSLNVTPEVSDTPQRPDSLEPFEEDRIDTAESDVTVKTGGLRSKLIEIEMAERGLERVLASQKLSPASSVIDEKSTDATESTVRKETSDQSQTSKETDAAEEGSTETPTTTSAGEKGSRRKREIGKISPEGSEKEFQGKNTDTGKGERKKNNMTNIKFSPSKEIPFSYVLTEGSPCEIPESVTTVIIPDRQLYSPVDQAFESPVEVTPRKEEDLKKARYERAMNAFGEYVRPESVECSTVDIDFLHGIKAGHDLMCQHQNLDGIQEEKEEEEEEGTVPQTEKPGAESRTSPAVLEDIPEVEDKEEPEAQSSQVEKPDNGETDRSKHEDDVSEVKKTTDALELKVEDKSSELKVSSPKDSDKETVQVSEECKPLEPAAVKESVSALGSARVEDHSLEVDSTECKSLGSSNEAKESSSEIKESVDTLDDPGESAKMADNSFAYESTGLRSTESSNEAKETTVSDRSTESLSLNGSRPVVPELNLDSLRDITISSFKMADSEKKDDESGRTISDVTLEPLTSDEKKMAELKDSLDRENGNAEVADEETKKLSENEMLETKLNTPIKPVISDDSEIVISDRNGGIRKAVATDEDTAELMVIKEETTKEDKKISDSEKSSGHSVSRKKRNIDLKQSSSDSENGIKETVLTPVESLMTTEGTKVDSDTESALHEKKMIDETDVLSDQKTEVVEPSATDEKIVESKLSFEEKESDVSKENVASTIDDKPLDSTTVITLDQKETDTKESPISKESVELISCEETKFNTEEIPSTPKDLASEEKKISSTKTTPSSDQEIIVAKEETIKEIKEDIEGKVCSKESSASDEKTTSDEKPPHLSGQEEIAEKTGKSDEEITTLSPENEKLQIIEEKDVSQNIIVDSSSEKKVDTTSTDSPEQKDTFRTLVEEISVMTSPKEGSSKEDSMKIADNQETRIEQLTSSDQETAIQKSISTDEESAKTSAKEETVDVIEETASAASKPVASEERVSDVETAVSYHQSTPKEAMNEETSKPASPKEVNIQSTEVKSSARTESSTVSDKQSLQDVNSAASSESDTKEAVSSDKEVIETVFEETKVDTSDEKSPKSDKEKDSSGSKPEGEEKSAKTDEEIELDVLGAKSPIKDEDVGSERKLDTPKSPKVTTEETTKMDSEETKEQTQQQISATTSLESVDPKVQTSASSNEEKTAETASINIEKLQTEAEQIKNEEPGTIQSATSDQLKSPDKEISSEQSSEEISKLISIDKKPSEADSLDKLDVQKTPESSEDIEIEPKIIPEKAKILGAAPKMPSNEKDDKEIDREIAEELLMIDRLENANLRHFERKEPDKMASEDFECSKDLTEASDLTTDSLKPIESIVDDSVNISENESIHGKSLIVEKPAETNPVDGLSSEQSNKIEQAEEISKPSSKLEKDETDSKLEKMSPKDSTDEKQQTLIVNEDKDVQLAATKIQARIRGFLIRYRLRKAQKEKEKELATTAAKQLEDPVSPTTDDSVTKASQDSQHTPRTSSNISSKPESLHKPFSPTKLQHTGEFHDCLPLPLQSESSTPSFGSLKDPKEPETPQDCYPEGNYSPEYTEEDINLQKQRQIFDHALSFVTHLLADTNSGDPMDVLMMQYGNEAALQDKYLNFITSVEDVEPIRRDQGLSGKVHVPKFDTTDSREDSANPGSSGSIREPLAVPGTPQGVVIEEITSLDEPSRATNEEIDTPSVSLPGESLSADKDGAEDSVPKNEDQQGKKTYRE